MKKRLTSILLLTTLLLVTSCKKQVIDTNKIEAPTLSPSFAIPIGYAELNLGDIEKEIDDDGLIYNAQNELFELFYEKNVFSFNASEYLSFDVQAFNNSIQAPAATSSAFQAGSAGTTVSFSDQISNTLAVTNGEQIDSVLINTGNLELTLSSEFSHDVTVTLSSNFLTALDGSSFSTQLNLQYAGSVPVVNSQTVDLTGYTLDLSKNGTTTNEIEFNVDVTLTHTGQPVSGTESIAINSNIQLNDYQAVYGYFGNIMASFDGETSIADFYENFDNGVLHFADPRLELKIYNTTGIEIGNSFDAIVDADDNSNAIVSGDGVDNIGNVAPALFVGDTAVTDHLINNANTSPTLTDLLDAAPESVIFQSVTETNPNGVAQNFITKESKVWAKATAVLPFFGYADQFSLADTADLDLAETLELSPEDNVTVEDVEKLLVRVITTNGMPIDANIQLYFADSMGVKLDSLFSSSNGEDILLSGQINTSVPVTDPNYGRVISSTEKVTDFVFVGARLKELIDQKSTKILYRISASTADAENQTDIKMYPEYEFRVKVSAKIDFKVNLEE